MVEFEWETDEREGVTFVAAIVTNTRSTPQRVRVESRLEGPTWPPQRHRVVAPEWSEEGWEATVEPGRRRGLGFATPTPSPEPPIEITEVTRTSDATETTPKEVLASLEAWSPTVGVLTPVP